ncbi:hypothetical protein ACOMHN_040937 [Nucella lapillus]
MLTPRKKAALVAAITVSAFTFTFTTLLHHHLSITPSYLRELGKNLTCPRFFLLPPHPLHDNDPPPTMSLPHSTGDASSSQASRAVTKVTASASTSKKETTPKTKKKVVYVCSGGCGGWADRQKGIVSAYVLSAMLGRDFGVHVTFPCDLQRLMNVGKVNWKVSPGELTGPGYRRVTQLDHAAVTYTKAFLQAGKSLEELFPHDVTAFTWNMEVVQFLQKHPLASRIGWLAGKSTPEVYKRVLEDLFVLKPDLQSQLDRFRSSTPPGSKLICAQVRLGKHNGSFPDVESWHTFEDFSILVNFLAKYNDSRRYRVFVSSDSAEIVQKSKARFPEVLVTIPGPITHTDKSQGAEACRGFQKAIVDEYALSLCDVLVISESGLGKIASFMRASDRDLYLFHRSKIDPFARNGTFPNKAGW